MFSVKRLQGGKTQIKIEIKDSETILWFAIAVLAYICWKIDTIPQYVLICFLYFSSTTVYAKWWRMIRKVKEDNFRKYIYIYIYILL